jgi:hypothetical protein
MEVTHRMLKRRRKYRHIQIYQSVSLSSKLLLPFFPTVYTESDQEYLKEIAEEGRQKFPPPLQITMSLGVLCGRRSPTGPIPKASEYQQKRAMDRVHVVGAIL